VSKSKNLGKGLAALIGEKKQPKNIKSKNKETNDSERADIDDEVLKKWADAKAMEKASSDNEEETQGEGKLSEKTKAYEAILAKYKKKKEERYKKMSEDIDEEIPAWSEEEYKSPIEFDYFDRNAKGDAKERYEKLLEKYKK